MKNLRREDQYDQKNFFFDLDDTLIESENLKKNLYFQVLKISVQEINLTEIPFLRLKNRYEIIRELCYLKGEPTLWIKRANQYSAVCNSILGRLLYQSDIFNLSLWLKRKGHRVILISKTPKRDLIKTVRVGRAYGLFEEIISVNTRKCKSVAMRRALNVRGLNFTSAAHFGDSPGDRIASSRSGIRFVRCNEVLTYKFFRKVHCKL